MRFSLCSVVTRFQSYEALCTIECSFDDHWFVEYRFTIYTSICIAYYNCGISLFVHENSLPAFSTRSSYTDIYLNIAVFSSVYVKLAKSLCTLFKLLECTNFWTTSIGRAVGVYILVQYVYKQHRVKWVDLNIDTGEKSCVHKG